MSDGIVIDSQGAKIGWLLLAAILGVGGTLYAENKLDDVEDKMDKKLFPLSQKVAELEFKARNFRTDITRLENHQ